MSRQNSELQTLENDRGTKFKFHLSTFEIAQMARISLCSLGEPSLHTKCQLG